MTIAFDHIIVLVHDLDAAARDYRALGFTVLERADTEHGKTRFRFVSFPDGSYILLTAFASAEAQASHRLGEVLADGEGWADWSFVLPDVTQTGAALAEAGFAVADPVRVSNIIADGRSWALDLLMCGRGAGGDVSLPFVISDVKGRAARIPTDAAPHANGATGIAGISISTGNHDAVARTLVALGGSNASSNRFDFGKGWVKVVPLDTPMGRRGGGVVELVLSGPQQDNFDLALTHGAPISMGKA